MTRLDPVKLVWIPDPRPAASRRWRSTTEADTASAHTDTGRERSEPPTPVVVEEPPNNRTRARTHAVAAPAPAAVRNRRMPRGHTASRSRATNPDPASAIRPGPGSGDGGVTAIGNGVTAPIPLRRPPPAYTAEAMRARLQGVVVLNCVVRPDGKCSDIRVSKSLDMMFGLDQQAIASAREWVFRPGMRMGQPVPVLVTLEIGFTIR